MPEGDTIHRSARRLKPLLENAHITDASDNGRFVDARQLVGARFSQVEARGKHLLMRLDDGRVLHSHMGMTGSWHTYQLEEPWRKSPRWAALAMTVSVEQTQAKVVCFSPKVLELLSPTQFRRHAFLNRLGPDLMLDGFDAETVLGRFRIHNLAPIGEAVMNQTIVCGIGNVYKSETLFLTRQNPFVRVGEFTDEAILTVVTKAQSLMHQNKLGYPRQTRLSSDGQHLWVYGRSGQPCFECGATIEMRRQGDLGRSTYWCPSCQNGRSMGPRPV